MGPKEATIELGLTIDEEKSIVEGGNEETSTNTQQILKEQAVLQFNAIVNQLNETGTVDVNAGDNFHDLVHQLDTESNHRSQLIDITILLRTHSSTETPPPDQPTIQQRYEEVKNELDALKIKTDLWNS